LATDDSHVDVQTLAPANPLKLSFLKKTQKVILQLPSNSGDFVEKNCASVR
jgi:hypothetical protein